MHASVWAMGALPAFTDVLTGKEQETMDLFIYFFFISFSRSAAQFCLKIRSKISWGLST